METNPNDWQEKYLQLKKEYEEFAYIVSHDLKAPLRAISNLSGWIKEDLGHDLSPDIKHNIQLLQNRTERMEGMVSALLAFSRIERTELDLALINVQEVVESWAAAPPAFHPVDLQIHNLPTFKTYAFKLQSVLHQLLDNAVKFNQNNLAKIWVSCQEKDNFYTFTIKDNGVGLSDDTQDKIFKMFFTVQPKEDATQLGTGLTLAQKTIQFVGGSLQVASVLGIGSTFTFTWPKIISVDHV